MSESAGSAGRNSKRGGRRPRGTNKTALVGWLFVIVIAAVVPYAIAKSTHGSSKPTTTSAVVPTTAQPSSTPASIGGAAAPSSATASPSAAAGGPPASTTPHATSAPSAPSSSPATPTTPSGTSAIGSPAATPEPTTKTYTVHAGDSLWKISETRLGAGASTAAINAAWLKLYQANRSVIGPNPSLLFTGEVLDLSL